MKIVVIGNGKVGYTLTQLLSKEGHDVVVIDSNSSILHEAQEALDVAVVDGNGALVQVQRAADVNHSDLAIAVTPADEINLLCCLVAHKLGCKSTIARVRDPQYDQQVALFKEDLGLSFSVNPEKAAALEIFRLLQLPSFLKRDSFAHGRVELVEFRLKPNSVLAGKRLDALGDIWSVNALICTVDRDGEIFIPSGSFCLQAGDKISVAADAGRLAELVNFLHLASSNIKNVLIVGGSRIATYLATMLLRSKIQVTIIEKDIDRCNVLCQLLPAATVINGNGTQQSLLRAEGIEETDAVVTLTGMDEENLIISMFANYVGVPKTITKINRSEYSAVFNNVGIDSIVSPKLLIANEIVQYVRAVSDSRKSRERMGGGGTLQALYRIMDGKAEALGFTVPAGGKYLDIPLSALKLKPNILLASIIRARRVIIPKGNDVIMAGDSVVVVTTADRAISNFTDIFRTLPTE